MFGPKLVPIWSQLGTKLVQCWYQVGPGPKPLPGKISKNLPPGITSCSEKCWTSLGTDWPFLFDLVDWIRINLEEGPPVWRKVLLYSMLEVLVGVPTCNKFVRKVIQYPYQKTIKYHKQLAENSSNNVDPNV